jgi:hypothetical protein
MGTSLAMIERTYGHLARDSEDAFRARLDARFGVDLRRPRTRGRSVKARSGYRSGLIGDGAYRDRTGDLLMPLTLFGVAALTFMMLMYALERRGPRFVLAFACGYALSSVYGFLAGTWPFGVVEAHMGGHRRESLPRWSPCVAAGTSASFVARARP